MKVLFIAEPRLVANGHATVLPFVVIRPFFRVAQRLFGFLRKHNIVHYHSRIHILRRHSINNNNTNIGCVLNEAWTPLLLLTLSFWNVSSAFLSPAFLSGWYLRALTLNSVLICSTYLTHDIILYLFLNYGHKVRFEMKRTQKKKKKNNSTIIIN